MMVRRRNSYRAILFAAQKVAELVSLCGLARKLSPGSGLLFRK